MNTTTPQAPAANNFDTPDPQVYRTPDVASAENVPVAREPLALTRDEIAAIYARQQLEMKIASETPLYTQILMERQIPRPGSPERPVNPLAAELIAVGDEILAIREDRKRMLRETPSLMKRSYIQRLAKFVFTPFSGDHSLTDEMIEKFIIEEERRVGGAILKVGSDSELEYGFHFERATRQKGLEVVQEDEWILHDLRTNQMVMYPIELTGMSKIYEGRPVPFIRNEHVDELANLRASIHHYRDQLKKQIATDQA